MVKDLPKWSELLPEERSAYGNGLGPEWAPEWVRASATKKSSRFFNEASWAHHDYGYLVGGDHARRKECDDLFLGAMLRDVTASELPNVFGVRLALTLYMLVRLFGWTAFRYTKE